MEYRKATTTQVISQQTRENLIDLMNSSGDEQLRTPEYLEEPT
jgi:hypothetical protein